MPTLKSSCVNWRMSNAIEQIHQKPPLRYSVRTPTCHQCHHTTHADQAYRPEEIPRPAASTSPPHDIFQMGEATTAPPDGTQYVPTPLHIALWIRECIQEGDGEVLEARDKRGNRALHLALKFAHRNSVAIVKCLIDAGARVRSRDMSGWKAVHQAVAAENEEILRLLAQTVILLMLVAPPEKEQAPALLAKKINTVCPQLAQVPNFYSEIHVDVSTWIPGVSRWLPSDTVKIWKKNHDIRFDISLVGFENGCWKRGKLSFLLLGGSGRFLCLDHEDKACIDLLAPDTRLSDADLDAMVHFLMTASIVTTGFDVANVKFDKKHRWLSKADVKQDIGQWKNTNVYEMSGVEAALRIRKPQNKHHKLPLSSSLPEPSTTTSDAFSVLTDAFTEQDKGTEVIVDPNSEHVVSTELGEQGVVTWKFSTAQYDISFGVKFLRECDGDDSEWEDVVPLQRCASHEQEQSGKFEAPTAGTVVFTWDNSYSRFRQKRVRFVIKSQDASTAAEALDLDSQDCHRARKEVMRFEDWFGVRIAELPSPLQALRPKQQIMVHVPPRCRELSKSFSATVCMSDDFPMSVHEFLPVIEVLSKTTSAFENVKAFFEAQLSIGFPVQFCFPLVPSISATFRFDKMELQTPDVARFAIPDDYKHFQEDVLSPRKHQEMLQRRCSLK
ncbi:hypothetical protein FI667_g5075, partial [Globisporangium splendens]